MKPTPYTLDDLRQLLPILKDRMKQMSHSDARPLPRMTTDECLEMLIRMMDLAVERPLTQEECFLHGQLLCQYKQAITAEVLGKKGRYYVVSEDDVAEMVHQQKVYDPWEQQ